MIIRLFFSTVVLIGMGQISKAQNSTSPQANNLSIGSLFGYDYSIQGLSYGVGLMYEYRPLKSLGLFTSLNYEQTRRKISERLENNLEDIWKHEIYSLSGGSRYYLNKYYLSAALGLAYEGTSIKLQNGANSKPDFNFNLYKSVGMGVQNTLRNSDIIEVEATTYGTDKSMKAGLSAKYRFGK